VKPFKRYLARHNPATDANQKGIVDNLRAIGASVWPLSGKGIPDLLVGYRGDTFLLEVKIDHHAQLRPAQKAFHESWRGGPIAVVTSFDEACAAIGAKVSR